MASKITIIGAGSVGATIAYTLANKDIASEIVMIDINRDKAEGEVLDIIQGTYFRDPIDLIAGDYEDAKDSDIVIITSGLARKPGQTRLELAQTNVNILKSIAPNIVAAAPNAKYIIVSNPVDVMTYVFHKISGIPESQIIGSEHFDVAQKNVHAYVFGEHGDSSFIPWSCATISVVPVDDYTKASGREGKIDELDKDEMLTYVQKSGGQIIANKGATFYAVAASVCQLCSMINSASNSLTTFSMMMHGEYGIDDVCLSVLGLIGPNGCEGKVLVNLTDEEVALLKKSADALKAVIAQINI